LARIERQVPKGAGIEITARRDNRLIT
jgi:hypothetical protein